VRNPRRSIWPIVTFPRGPPVWTSKLARWAHVSQGETVHRSKSPPGNTKDRRVSRRGPVPNADASGAGSRTHPLGSRIRCFISIDRVRAVPSEGRGHKFHVRCGWFHFGSNLPGATTMYEPVHPGRWLRISGRCVVCSGHWWLTRLALNQRVQGSSP